MKISLRTGLKIPLRAGLIGTMAVMGLALFLLPAWALEPLPAPSGKVVLVIDGKITNTNAPGNKALLDLALLQSLTRRKFTTTTVWTDGPQTFEGVVIADLLQRLGATGNEIHAYASNDYEITFSRADPVAHGAIIADSLNGAPLPEDNKGPLWIVYPFDDDPLLRSERFQSQAVWSLETLTIQ